MNLKRLLNDVTDIVFPPRCPACAAWNDLPDDSNFCRTCRAKIQFITGSICPICGIPFSDTPAADHICGSCLENKPYFSQARAAVSYKDVILEVIHKFKYGRDMSAGSTLGNFLAGFPFPDFDFAEYSLLIPVPLHWKRLRERGFNQSLLLARKLEKKYSLPVNFSLLKRIKFTLTQTGLNKAERQKNVQGAFEVKDKEKVPGQKIILVDDVYTTGSTINECARVLLRAGAEKVSVLTIARVIPDSSR